MKFVDGDDLDLLVSLAVKLAVLLVINLHGNFRLALDDVEIGDEITVRVDEEARTQAFRRADLHDRLADLLDERTHIARGRGEQRGIIKLRRDVEDWRWYWKPQVRRAARACRSW